MEAKKTVRGLREERGWTQVELGRRSGVHPISLSRIESGRAEPTVRTLRRIADALGITIDEIALVSNVAAGQAGAA